MEYEQRLLGIEIQYSKKEKGYHLVENNYDELNFQRMLEAFDLFNSLQISHDMSSFIHLENRRPQGTENLYGLLHAIKNNLQIRYEYSKFWGAEGQEQRHTDPYALKEFKNRWYLIALDQKDQKIKTFALERISALEITERKFDYPASFNVEEFLSIASELSVRMLMLRRKLSFLLLPPKAVMLPHYHFMEVRKLSSKMSRNYRFN